MSISNAKQTTSNKHFRDNYISILACNSNYFYQYYLKEGKVKITILSIPTDNNKNIVLTYVQFNPDVIDLEAELYRTSAQVYNIEDQLFSFITSNNTDIFEKVKMSIAYINASVN